MSWWFNLWRWRSQSDEPRSVEDRTRFKGVLTPKRKHIFRHALVYVTPDKLRELATAFADEELMEQAEALRKRADELEANPEVRT